MRLRTVHAAITVAADLHPEPLVFAAVGGGVYEGDVPEAVGAFLLSIGRPGEFLRLDAPGATPPLAPEAAPLGPGVAPGSLGDAVTDPQTGPGPDPDSPENQADDMDDGERTAGRSRRRR